MSVSDSAKAFYDAELKEAFEKQYFGKFVAIEPESRQHFIGDTFLEAAMQAKTEIPDRMSFVIRVGYDAAAHIGAAKT